MKRQGTTEEIQFQVFDTGSVVTGLSSYDFRVNIVKPSGATLKYPQNVTEQDDFHAPGVYELTLAPGDLDEEGEFGVIIRPRSKWIPSELTGVDTLRDADFISATDGWAVGDNGTVIHTTDGGDTWSAQTSNTTNDLYGVWAVGASEVYAVGENETLLSYDGTSWSVEHSAGTAIWYDLVVDSSTDIVLVEDTGNVVRWDGSQTILENGSTSGGDALHTISKPASSTFIAAGDNGTIIRTADDGSSWSSVSSGTTEDLRGSNFVSADGWIVGISGVVLHSTDTGSSWSSQSTPLSLNLQDVGFADASTGWAIGQDGALIETSDGGTTWSRDTTVQDNALWGLHVFSTSSALFVGGDEETVVVSGETSPPSFDRIFRTFEVGDPLSDKVDRLLGLSKENYRITDQKYDSNNNLIEAEVALYDTASDTINMANPIAEYTIKAFYDTDQRLKDYRMTKD